MAKSRPRTKPKQDEASRQKLLAARRAQYQQNREQILKRIREKRLNNLEAAKEKERRSRLRNREKRNARNREYMRAARIADPEKFRRRAKENAAKHRESARARSARYYAKHKKKAQAANNRCAKRRKESDPGYVIAIRLRNRLRKAVAARSAKKHNATLALVGCSINYLISHIESQFLPGMSWKNRQKWHLDHIIPLAAFDLTDPQQQAAACHYTNIQPLWARDNHKKGARPPQPQNLFGFAYADKIAQGLGKKPNRTGRKRGRQHGDD
jgi:hypothetical protein